MSEEAKFLEWLVSCWFPITSHCHCSAFGFDHSISRFGKQSTLPVGRRREAVRRCSSQNKIKPFQRIHSVRSIAIHEERGERSNKSGVPTRFRPSVSRHRCGRRSVGLWAFDIGFVQAFLEENLKIRQDVFALTEVGLEKKLEGSRVKI